MEDYQKCARQAAAESCVLIENQGALPILKDTSIAVFGVNAFHYYKSGLGSGGLVNARYVVSILDALEQCDSLHVNQYVKRKYQTWLETHPFHEGGGWGETPWSQQEMPLAEETVARSREESDTAIIMIGRTAGEDQDNTAAPGSYLLTVQENKMLELVCRYYERSIVLLNVGNIVDMGFVERYHPNAVMYVWQGGQEGGNGVLDVLTGEVNPCGKLTDTIAESIEAYPSTAYFGNETKNYYKEDIYVGYRYFETFAGEKVKYPFGYGLSYSRFEIQASLDRVEEDAVIVHYVVKNTGNCAGKEVVQIYVEPPAGKLAKAARVLIGFEKTGILNPGWQTEGNVKCTKRYFASFDDAGEYGRKSVLLLEKGIYRIWAGNNVRECQNCGEWEQEKQIFTAADGYVRPIESFERIRAVQNENGLFEKCVETVEGCDRKKEMVTECRKEKTDLPMSYTGSCGYRLEQVLKGDISLEDFLAQLTDRELIHLMRGEGMCSPKVTPGTAAAFGGLTEKMKALGIPVACCADGPSGIRMDCGTKAFSLPCGTALACTFNTDLSQKLYYFLGLELAQNDIDMILGPGINIHRNPLNGRNFEYFSEDPLLTGKMCAAQLRGLHEAGVEGCVKHFCGNNQEKKRTETEAVISEKALWEIYLKGFQMAVTEGKAAAVMTTYGAVNGQWTAGNYELCTGILRREWNYTGIVITDWWAKANWTGEEADPKNTAAMVAAQNDIYMCCSDTLEADQEDNLCESLEKGRIQRDQLVRNARDVLRFLMNSRAMKRMLGESQTVKCLMKEADIEEQELVSKLEFVCADREHNEIRQHIIEERMGTGTEALFGVELYKNGWYEILLEASSRLQETAQIPVMVYMDNIYRGAVTFRGGCEKNKKSPIKLGYIYGKNHYIKLVYRRSELDDLQVSIYPVEKGE